MGGLYELLVFLFSGSEMMLTTVTKVLIVETLRQQYGLPPLSHTTSHISHVRGRSLVPGSTLVNDFTDNISLFQPWDNSRTFKLLQNRNGLALNGSATIRSWRDLVSSSAVQLLETSTKALSEEETYLFNQRPHTKALSSLSVEDRNSPNRETDKPSRSFQKSLRLSILTKRSSDNKNILDDALGTLWKSPTLHSKRHSRHPSRGEDPDSVNVSVRTAPSGAGISRSGFKERVSWYLLMDQVCIYLPWTFLGIPYGAWSDRHGRKLLLLLPGACQTLAVLGYLIVGVWPQHLLVLVLLGGLTRGACGKHAMFTTALYSSVSDLVPHEHKSAKFASLLGFRYMGVCSGTLGAGITLGYFNLSHSFLLASFLQVLCFLLVVFGVEESLPVTSSTQDDKNTTFCSTLKTFFVLLRNLESVEEKIALSKKGTAGEESDQSVAPEKERGKNVSRHSWLAAPLCMVIVIFVLTFLTQWLWSSHREMMVQVVSLPPFEWPSSWYAYLFGVIFGSGGLATLTLVPLVLRFSPAGSSGDLNVLVIALLSGFCGCLWSVLAVNVHSSWQVFTSSCLVAVGISCNSTCRAMLSKHLPGPSGQASGQAMLSVLENVAKVLGPLGHTAIFVSTSSDLPALVFGLMAGEIMLMLALVAFMWRNFKRDDYQVP